MHDQSLAQKRPKSEFRKKTFDKEEERVRSSSFSESDLQRSCLRPIVIGKTQMRNKIIAYEDYQHDEYKGPHIGNSPSVQDHKVPLEPGKTSWPQKTFTTTDSEEIL